MAYLCYGEATFLNFALDLGGRFELFYLSLRSVVNDNGNVILCEAYGQPKQDNSSHYSPR